MVDITKMGRKRANPDAALTNNLRLSDCASCTETLGCLDYYEAAVPTTETIQSVTVNGVVVPLPTPVLATAANMDSFRDQVAAILASGNPEEYDVFVRAEYGVVAATTLSFAHVGTKTISAITTNIGAKVVTRSCTTATFSDFELTLVGSIPNIGNGTTQAALSPTTYAYTGVSATDTTTAGTLKTQIVAALGTLGVAFRAVNVTVNNSVGAFDIEIKRQRDGVYLYAGTNKFKEVNFSKNFVGFPLGL